MDIFEAINSRIACRQFIDKPVDFDIVRDLICGAARAASSLNLQPWNVYAVTGEPLREIAEAIAHRDWRTFETEYPESPGELWEPYLSRRVDFGSQLYGALGVDREDAEARLEQIKRNFMFSMRRPGSSSPSTTGSAPGNGRTLAGTSTHWHSWHAGTGSTRVHRYCGYACIKSCVLR